MDVSTGFIDVTIRNMAHSYDTTNILICNFTVWNNLLIDVSGDYDYTFIMELQMVVIVLLIYMQLLNI